MISDLLEDWIGRFLLMVVAMMLVFVVGAWQTWAFNRSHECVRTQRYWQRGHMVGVVGKGGHWQPARWRVRCVEFRPNDPTPMFYLE